MRVEAVKRTTESSGALASAFFRADVANLPHLFGILRRGLYSEPVLAQLREYGGNAYDAHVDAFRGDEPFRVDLPTEIEPTLIIRDYGWGLSQHDMLHLMTSFGMSTKRDSDAAMGYIGIGSKAGHAYTDSFTFISRHGGMRKTYVAYLDETDIGKIDLVDEEPCVDEPTGLEVHIPVRKEDIPLFRKAAEFLFRFFDPQPQVNFPIPPCPFQKGDPGWVDFGHQAPLDSTRPPPPRAAEKPASIRESRWLAVMGVIPYRIDFNKLSDGTPETEELIQASKNLAGGLVFRMGEVTITPSREELQYTQQTKATVLRQFQKLIAQVVRKVDATMQNESLSGWERRVQVREFFMQTQIAPEKRHQGMNQEWVPLYDPSPLKDGDGNPLADETGTILTGAPKTFRLHGFKKRQTVQYHSQDLTTRLAEAEAIEINAATRVIVQDVDTSFSRFYGYRETDRIVKPVLGATLPMVQAELSSLLHKAGLDGIPLVMLSSLPTHHGARGGALRSKAASEKHRVRMFVLRPPPFRTPRSDNWDIVDRVPTGEDVYVVLSRFEVLKHHSFYSDFGEHQQILADLGGGPMPPIYGIKTTQREPVVAGSVLGQPYHVWIEAQVRARIADRPDLQADFRRILIAQAYSRAYSEYEAHHRKSLGDALVPYLGADHPLVRWHSEGDAALRWHLGVGKKALAQRISRVFTMPQDPAILQAYQDLVAPYPLLDLQNHGPGFGVFRKHSASVWAQYITSIDEKGATCPTTTAPTTP